MMSERSSSIPRKVGIAIGATFLILINIACAALLFATTNRAREAVVAFAVKKLQPVFPGGFEIGSSEGTLPIGIVLNDVVIRDLDERPAVEIERLELRYALLPLLLTRVQVNVVRVDGVSVVSQPLRDGRNNLATMAVIEKPLPPVPRALPVSIRLAAVDIDARFISLAEGETADTAPADHDARARLHLAASLSHGMVATLDQLVLDVAAPARAKITASGGVQITEDPQDMDFRDVLVRVDGDTTQLRRRVEKLELAGPASIVARANGSAHDLVASLTADTTQPPVSIRVAAHVYKDSAVLEALKVTAPFARVSADGVYKFDRTGQGQVHVDAPDLRPFALLGAPAMSGSVRLDGGGSRDAEHTKIKLEGTINKLHIEQDRIEHASLQVDVTDLHGKADLAAEAVVLGTVALRTIGVKLDASPKSGRVVATARGAEGVELDVAIEGVPHLMRNRLTALDATLERLHFRAGGTPWNEVSPAHFHANLDAKDYSLDKLALENAKQRIEATGHVKGETIENASLDVQHFDLAPLAGFIAPGHVLPRSDLSAKIDADGPLAQPNVNAKVGGTADGRGSHDLIHATVTSEGRLTKGRLNATVFATIGGQKTSAKVDMPLPLKPAQPIDASFDASVLLNPWFADLLVPKLIQSQPIILYSLGTTVLVQGSVTGTTSDPHVNLGARLRNWGAENGHGSVGLSMEYEKKKMSVSGTIHFSELPLGGGSAAGVVQGTAIMPVDLGPALSGTRGRFLDSAAEWHAELKVNHVDIEKMPFKAFAIVPVTNHGKVDGSFELSGSRSHPNWTAKLQARGLNVSGVADVDLVGNAKLDGDRATAELEAAVHGSERVQIKGSIDGARVIDWYHAPLAFTFTSEGFDLGRLNVLKSMNGRARGALTLTGTLNRPMLRGTLNVAQLQLGAVTYDAVGLKAAGETFELTAVDHQGGKLAGTLALRGHMLEGDVTAKHFHLDIESELLPRLREASGELDGNLRIAGSLRAPELRGALTLAHGEFKMATSAISYKDAQASIAFSGQKADVKAFKMAAGDQGSLEGTGSITLGRLLVDRVSGKAKLKRYPMLWDTMTGLTDATIAFDGKRSPNGGFETKFELDQAFVELVDDRGTRGLIQTAHLEDVKVEKARPQPIVGPLEPTPKLAARNGRTHTISLEGPLTVRSSGIDFRATAALTLDLDTQTALITGELTLEPGSIVKVFGNNYQVKRGRFEFDHAALPRLDFSLSRMAKGERIGVDIAGPARQPVMTFWDETTKLSPPQIAAAITGQRASKDGLEMKGLSTKVDGPLSDLIAVSLSQTAPNKPYAKLPLSSPKMAP